MQTYEVKNASAVFGVGMILSLTAEQASLREHSLTKKDGVYIVNCPVSFKKGEKVSVVSGEVSKAFLLNVGGVSNSGLAQDNDEEDDNNENEEFPKIVKISRGNYDVFDKDGNKINEEPMIKAEATKLLDGLAKE